MLFFLQKKICRLAFALVLAPTVLGQLCFAETLVNAASKPGATWRLHPTLLVSDLPSNNAVQSLDQFGGLASPLTIATGFFHTQLIGQRWWLVTPDGGLFISRGMNSVSQISTPGGRTSLKQKFNSSQKWGRSDARPSSKRWFQHTRSVVRHDHLKKRKLTHGSNDLMVVYVKLRQKTWRHPPRGRTHWVSKRLPIHLRSRVQTLLRKLCQKT